jgi:hypothetical protein
MFNINEIVENISTAMFEAQRAHMQTVLINAQYPLKMHLLSRIGTPNKNYNLKNYRKYKTMKKLYEDHGVNY